MNGIDIGKISKEGYYFKLPDIKVMSITYIAFQLISSLITTEALFVAFFTAAFVFTLAFSFSHLLHNMTRKFSVSKPNRFFGMLLLQTSVSTLCQILAFLLSPLNKAISLFVLLSGIFCSIFLLVSLAEVFAATTVPSVLIWAISTGSTFLYALKFIEPLVLFCLVAFSFLGALCLLHYVNSSSASKMTFKPTRMFRPYLEYKLEGKGENLEALLKSASRSSKVKLTAICFEKSGLPLFLVNLGLHFGPFDRIGSSALPSDAFFTFRDRIGAVALFTHSFSSHENDIPSKEEVENVLDRSLEALREHSNYPVVEMTPFFRSSYGSFDVWVALCGDTSICVASSKNPMIDDLPESAINGILDESKRFGINNLYDIDAHNNISFPPPNRPSEARCEDLIEGYRIALSSALASPRQGMRLGYANVQVDGRQDIGPLGISALVFDFGTSRQALVILDGNNMVEGLVEKAVSRVEDIGVSETLVITNDNHLLTGVFKVDGGYYPVGAKDEDVVVEKIAQAVENAIQDLSECKVRVVTAEVGDTPILGDGLGDLLMVTMKALRRFKISLAGYLLYSLLLSALGASFG